MWKSLRIGALLALAALGALKLAQYTVARGQMERLASAVAPSLRLGYSDVSGALDGRVILEDPRLEVLTGPARGSVVRASRATIEPAGVFWLLRRAVTGDASVPAGLDVRLQGVSLSQPALDHASDEGWFGAASLVPFESVGCGTATKFSARDYARMGLAVRPRDDDIRYAYDAAARTLSADIVSTAAPFSTITAHLELSQFNPSAWFGDARALEAQRIEQFSLTYLDGGYLAKRNRFCAQLTGTDAGSYASRHLAAVKSFLGERGVIPGDEVANLYAKLVTEGGSAELSSLPEAAFVPADFAGYVPEDLLRQLNVTLRRNTAPPILMRLAFADPAAVDPEAVDTSTVAIEQEAPAASEPEPEPPAVAEPVAAPPVAVARTEGMPLLSTANAASVPIETPPVLLAPVPSEVIAVATPEPAVASWANIGHPLIDPRNAVEAIPASAPPPPPDSTAALVWRAPTIERLPEKTVALSNYVSIPTAALGGYIGQRVRLLTTGGKVVEGRVHRIDGADVVMLILRDGGSAQMRIPRAGIREARVRRAALPDSAQ
jgi:hypothetical protein